MVKTVEAKPPAALVDAIQDAATAPREAAVLGDTSATRAIAAKLAHETPQRPSDLPDQLRHGDDHNNPATPGAQMDAQEKHLKTLEAQHAQHKAEQYDRSHPGAGKAGRGDQAIDSAHCISRDARGQQGS